MPAPALDHALQMQGMSKFGIGGRDLATDALGLLDATGFELLACEGKLSRPHDSTR
jgi:hypothetical protein